MKNKVNIVYMGTPGFAVAPLQAILKAGYNVVAVVTVPDKPAGRGRKVHTSAVKDFAAENNLKVLQPVKLKSPEFIKEITQLKPDIMVVVAFRMLPAVVWKIPAMGTFNLHASLLPNYRGAAPINWAVMNGEKESGVTTFLIDDEIDTGNILLQEKVILADKETAGTLHDKLMQLGAELVVKTLDKLVDGNIASKKQVATDHLKSAPKIFREDCRINWNNSGNKIESFIRGLSPFPAAFTTVASEEVNGDMKILDASFFADSETNKSAQMIIEGKKLVVLLPDGKLELEKVQPQGKRAMSATDFINGIRNKEQIFNLK